MLHPVAALLMYQQPLQLNVSVLNASLKIKTPKDLQPIRSTTKTEIRGTSWNEIGSYKYFFS